MIHILPLLVLFASTLSTCLWFNHLPGLFLRAKKVGFLLDNLNHEHCALGFRWPSITSLSPILSRLLVIILLPFRRMLLHAFLFVFLYFFLDFSHWGLERLIHWPLPQLLSFPKPYFLQPNITNTTTCLNLDAGLQDTKLFGIIVMQQLLISLISMVVLVKGTVDVL